MIFSLFKEADKAIEPWILHWIDQIESNYEHEFAKEKKDGNYG
jgi:hypothetical protein